MISRRLHSVAIATVALFGFGAGSAHAGIPALEVNFWVNGNLVQSYNPGGNDNGNGTFTWAGSIFDDPFEGGTGTFLDFSFTGDVDDSPLLSSNFTIDAPSSQSIDVVLEVILPINAIGGATELAGSAAVGLTSNNDGGVLSSLADTPVWQALLDSTEVGNAAALFFDPFEITHSGAQSSGVQDDFGLDGGPVAGPPAMESMGIRVSFSLTDGDQMSLTGVFSVIPGPGALAVFAGGLLFAGRRRRRH